MLDAVWNRLEFLGELRKHRIARWVFVLWALVSVYDTFGSQLLPTDLVQKRPTVYQLVAMTTGWLSWQSWLLIGAAVLTAFALEYVNRAKRQSVRVAAISSRPAIRMSPSLIGMIVCGLGFIVFLAIWIRPAANAVPSPATPATPAAQVVPAEPTQPPSTPIASPSAQPKYTKKQAECLIDAFPKLKEIIANKLSFRDNSVIMIMGRLQEITYSEPTYPDMELILQDAIARYAQGQEALDAFQRDKAIMPCADPLDNLLSRKDTPNLGTTLGNYLAQIQLNKAVGINPRAAISSLRPFASEAASAMGNYNSWSGALRARVAELSPKLADFL